MKTVPTVCVIEDRDAEAALLELALEDLEPQVEVRRLRDGVEALDFFTRVEQPPALVLLDLRMPGMDGVAVLRALRDLPAPLGTVPVVVFSSSDDPDDVDRAYDAHANSFVRKPIRFLDYRERVRGVVRYWIDANTLPQRRLRTAV